MSEFIGCGHLETKEKHDSSVYFISFVFIFRGIRPVDNYKATYVRIILKLDMYAYAVILLFLYICITVNI